MAHDFFLRVLRSRYGMRFLRFGATIIVASITFLSHLNLNDALE